MPQLRLCAAEPSGINAGMLYYVAALVGLVSGVTSGIFGVGGGIVMVPALTLWLRQDIKTAIGTSLAVIVPAACMGVFKHGQFGHVQWRLALAMIPLALAGGYVGAWLAKVTPSATLGRLFGGFLLLVGAYLLLRKQ